MIDVTTLRFGLDTFGDVTHDAQGRPKPAAQVIRDVVEQGVLADEVGVDAIGLGEHHRDDFSISTPDVVLAAIAARTNRILLGSAVTVLSSDDPIRVFQRFSTLDALSSHDVSSAGRSAQFVHLSDRPSFERTLRARRRGAALPASGMGWRTGRARRRASRPR